MTLRFEKDWLDRASGESTADLIVEGFVRTRPLRFTVDRRFALDRLAEGQGGSGGIADRWAAILRSACERAYRRVGAVNGQDIRVEPQDFKRTPVIKHQRHPSA